MQEVCETRDRLMTAERPDRSNRRSANAVVRIGEELYGGLSGLSSAELLERQEDSRTDLRLGIGQALHEVRDQLFGLDRGKRPCRPCTVAERGSLELFQEIRDSLFQPSGGFFMIAVFFR